MYSFRKPGAYRFCWVAYEHWESACLISLVLELQIQAAVCNPLHGCYGFKLKSSCLHDQHLALRAVSPVPVLIWYASVCRELLNCAPSLGLLTFLATFSSLESTLDLLSVEAEMVPGHSRNWVSVICFSGLLSDLNIQRQHFWPLIGSYLPTCGPRLCQCKFQRGHLYLGLMKTF